jgi:hypothetical protein
MSDAKATTKNNLSTGLFSSLGIIVESSLAVNQT